MAASALLVAALFLTPLPLRAGPVESPWSEPSLPEAPQPNVAIQEGPGAEKPGSEKAGIDRCDLFRGGAAMAFVASDSVLAASGASPRPAAQLPGCPSRMPLINWYSRFITGPQVKPMTPKEKAWLAVRNVGDPFNLITILGEAGISVGANSHSPYGPGFMGWGRYAGDSFTQNLTGEFFGTFLIPSLVHQDPHYHRMPNATVKRRVFHAISQVAWTQGDNGKGMPNYANLVGFAIDDEIANLYVPGRETNLEASASRYATGLASAPIDNFVA